MDFKVERWKKISQAKNKKKARVAMQITTGIIMAFQAVSRICSRVKDQHKNFNGISVH